MQWMPQALNAQITENRNSERAYIDPQMGQRSPISWVASNNGKTKNVALFFKLAVTKQSHDEHLYKEEEEDG